MVKKSGGMMGLAIVFALSGCAHTADGDSSAFAGQQFAGYDIPSIIAAYKEDIAGFQGTVVSDLARGILEDGWVTDEELREVQSKFKTCLADAGITGVKFYSNGSYDVDDNWVSALDGKDAGEITEQDVAADPLYRCSEETDEAVIEMAYQMMRTNPENIDSDALMVDCLKEKGAVEQGFTEQDLNKAYENAGADNSLMRSDAYHTCLMDPLGLLSDASEVTVP